MKNVTSTTENINENKILPSVSNSTNGTLGKKKYKKEIPSKEKQNKDGLLSVDETTLASGSIETSKDAKVRHSKFNKAILSNDKKKKSMENSKNQTHIQDAPIQLLRNESYLTTNVEKGSSVKRKDFTAKLHFFFINTKQNMFK